MVPPLLCSLSPVVWSEVRVGAARWREGEGGERESVKVNEV